VQTFKYKAVSKDGAKVSGMVEAFDEYAAVTKIKETCAVVTALSEVQETQTEKKELSRGRIREKSLSIMCSQFSIILGAGLPVVRAVELIAEQTEDRTLKRILQQAAGDVSGGFGLAQSFENKGKNLPVTFIETVRSGEESGTLESAFARLHQYYDRSARLKGKVQTAMVYPVFTLIVAAAVVAIIMIKAVPTFVSSFKSMNIALPGPTKALIAISEFFTNYWFVLILVIAGGLLAYRLVDHTESGKLRHHRGRLKIPVLGRLNLMKATAQFANTMTTLLSAGLPMMRALTITARIMDNAWIGDALSKQLPHLEEGKTLAHCLRNANVFPKLLTEMTGVGEETGTLEHTLDVVGDYYNNETEITSQKALNLLEPIVIVLLAVIVVMILLAVYLPMFSLYGGL
jgi:type IV pilus assembly protein PilC